MVTELQAALEASQLRSSGAASAAIADGWQIERVGPPAVATEMSVATYRIRAAHVRAKAGEYWQQLAACTEEFAENLQAVIGTPLESIAIRGLGEHQFVVFQSHEGKILGCLFVKSAGREATTWGVNEPAA